MWGAWALGMAASSPAMLRRLERAGMGAIQPAQGLAALAALLQGLGSGIRHNATTAQPIANPFIWARLQRPGQAVPFMFASLLDGAPPAEALPLSALQRDGTGSSADCTLGVARAAGATEGSYAERRTVLERELLALVQGMLGPQVNPPKALISMLFVHYYTMNTCRTVSPMSADLQLSASAWPGASIRQCLCQIFGTCLMLHCLRYMAPCSGAPLPSHLYKRS